MSHIRGSANHEFSPALLPMLRLLIPGARAAAVGVDEERAESVRCRREGETEGFFDFTPPMTKTPSSVVATGDFLSSVDLGGGFDGVRTTRESELLSPTSNFFPKLLFLMPIFSLQII